MEGLAEAAVGDENNGLDGLTWRMSFFDFDSGIAKGDEGAKISYQISDSESRLQDLRRQ